MFLSSRFSAKFLVTFGLLLNGCGNAVRAAFLRKEFMMPTRTKNVFFGILSLVGLLALPPLATARDKHWGQHEGREHRFRAELSARDRRGFESYLDAHWETAQILYQQPELINNRRFLRNHRALRDWLAGHTRAARIIQANPRQVLWGQRTPHRRTSRTISLEDGQRLDHSQDTH
jgi:hypothetical protein